MCSCICGITLCSIVYHQPVREGVKERVPSERRGIEESAAALCSLHSLLLSTSWDAPLIEIICWGISNPTLSAAGGVGRIKRLPDWISANRIIPWFMKQQRNTTWRLRKEEDVVWGNLTSPLQDSAGISPENQIRSVQKGNGTTCYDIKMNLGQIWERIIE